MITVEDLYNHFSILNNAKDDAAKHEDSYKLILGGLKSGSHEKRLASQFVARFYKHFPNHAERSLESMFDLCEDPDASVRKQAIKDLPLICKSCPINCQKVADVVTQLLHGSDPLETNLAQMSLMSMLRVDIKATLAGMFGQILHGDEAIRSRAINFLGNKMKILISEDLLSKDGAEEYFVAQCKKVLDDVTGNEFTTFMKILSMIPSMSSLQGRLQLLQIISDQAELSKPFEAADLDGINCLIQCIKQATLLFSKNVHSHHYVEYICMKVLPHLDEIPSPDVQLEFARLLAEMVTFCGPLSHLDTCVKNTFDRLLTFMPLPPAETGEVEMAAAIPKLQFSYVESLMYSFHQLAKNAPLFLIGPENADRLKDFRLRLQYFGRGVQAYIKSLKSASDASSVEKVSEEVKSLALKTTSNINTLIWDLFHNPPSYKASIGLSFKRSVESTDGVKTGNKRSIEAATGSSNNQGKRVKTEQAFYVPPGIKQRSGNFPTLGQGRGGNRNGNFKKY